MKNFSFSFFSVLVQQLQVYDTSQNILVGFFFASSAWFSGLIQRRVFPHPPFSSEMEGASLKGGRGRGRGERGGHPENIPSSTVKPAKVARRKSSLKWDSLQINSAIVLFSLEWEDLSLFLLRILPTCWEGFDCSVLCGMEWAQKM